MKSFFRLITFDDLKNISNWKKYVILVDSIIGNILIISIDHITWHTVPAMETTEAVKLWLSPESVFERASETGTQNKQSKEKKVWN